MIIIDPGHGGLDVSGRYVTPGKRSPVLPNNQVLYEGVNNRLIAHKLKAALDALNIESTLLFDSFMDVSLKTRIQRANALCKDHKCLLISIHSDAIGNGREWMDAKGITTFHAPNASAKSKVFAGLVSGELKASMNGLTTSRGVKVGNFAMVRDTNCPAVLLELGFHTNLEEVTLMFTPDWSNRIVKGIISAIAKYQTT